MDNLDTLMETIRGYRFELGDDEKQPDDGVRLADRGAVGQPAWFSGRYAVSCGA